MDEIINIWANKFIEIDYIIWNKNKFIEYVNVNNISEISMVKKIKRLIIFEDNY
jgi:hypothetical protein